MSKEEQGSLRVSGDRSHKPSVVNHVFIIKAYDFHRMKIKEMLEDSRPRERLVKFGAENLSDAEILALILEKGTRQENVIEMSDRLIF